MLYDLKNKDCKANNKFVPFSFYLCQHVLTPVVQHESILQCLIVNELSIVLLLFVTSVLIWELYNKQINCSY